jgi:hypothetical protein
MPKLKTVIASILNALDSAQHQSNITTSKLAEQYQKDDALKYLQLPNAVMSEVEMDLRFAIKEYVENLSLMKTAKLDTETTKITLNKSANLATAEKLVDKVRASLPEKAAALLSDDTKRKLLVSRVQDTLYTSGIEKKSADDTSTAVSNVISSALLEGEPVSLSQKKNLSEIIKNDRLALGSFTSEDVGELDVIVDAASLASIPEEHIQKLHIKVEMQNYRWIQGDNSPGEFVIVD